MRMLHKLTHSNVNFDLGLCNGISERALGFFTRTQEALVSANHYYNAHFRRLADIGKRFNCGAVYLHIVLI